MSSTISFKERLRTVPLSPGVYLFRNISSEVLYVGKASVLRSRLRSYITSSKYQDLKIRRLMAQAIDFEYIVTHSESEALILENTLIKKYRPFYNARLKDDKGYPYIKIDLTESFPQVYFTRRMRQDGARYFGPYASARSVRSIMNLLKKLFPYRSCTKAITGTDSRPCLEFYINRCVAPCVGAVSKAEYHKVIEQVILFLEGKTAPVVHTLRSSMNTAADNLDYEKAAAIRDQIRAIETVAEEQKVAGSKDENIDVIGLAIKDHLAWAEVFAIRHGQLIGRERFTMEGTADDYPAQVLGDFIKQFYDTASFIPATLLVQHPIEDQAAVQSWLSEKRSSKVHIRVPVRGAKAKLLDLVAKNALQGIEERRAQWFTDSAVIEESLIELQDHLNLPNPPNRIECYDISNTQGTNAVGSMSVLLHGKIAPSHYRRFKIKHVSTINDYAMMQEMLRRRFKRLGTHADHFAHSPQCDGPISLPAPSKDTWAAKPDLVLIDGGKGHLSAALQVFLELGIDNIPLASLAKENEELFVPQMAEPVVLPRTSPALFIVQRARDEAHRFAITYHRKLRSKASRKSILDSIQGIGPKRKKRLLATFGSLKGLREATLEQVTALPGFPQALAQRLKDLI
jgi:excinuclease ABC subunit C